MDAFSSHQQGQQQQQQQQQQQHKQQHKQEASGVVPPGTFRVIFVTQ